MRQSPSLFLGCVGRTPPGTLVLSCRERRKLSCSYSEISRISIKNIHSTIPGAPAQLQCILGEDSGVFRGTET